MKKSVIRTIAIVSAVAAMTVLGIGIANPTAMVPTTHRVIKQVSHTGKLAAPRARIMDVHAEGSRTQFATAEFSADTVYPGQPILVTMWTTWHTAHIEAPTAHVKAVRPILDQYFGSEGAVITRMMAVANNPTLSVPVGHIQVGYWQISFPKLGKQPVTVSLGDGRVRHATITVVPVPTEYNDVQFQGVSEATAMQLGVDPSSEQPAHWPWSFEVRVKTNHTHYSHGISNVTAEWSVPFILHADEQGQIIETLTTPRTPNGGTFSSPSETFAPQQAAKPDYVATYFTPTTVAVKGTVPIRFWVYWLGHHHDAQSWTWQPTLYAEWEWVALAGLFAGLSLLGGFGRKNRDKLMSQTKTGDNVTL